LVLHLRQKHLASFGVADDHLPFDVVSGVEHWFRCFSEL
jgi:hypothetical protein